MYAANNFQIQIQTEVPDMEILIFLNWDLFSVYLYNQKMPVFFLCPLDLVLLCAR